MIINEMAGSGGDLMPYMFRRRRSARWSARAPGAAWSHTPTRRRSSTAASMIAPRGGFFTRDGKWAVENEGVGPDIEVENWPKEVIAGRDPQLERGRAGGAAAAEGDAAGSPAQRAGATHLGEAAGAVGRQPLNLS